MAIATFNSAFRAANESRHRYKILMGGAGSGKSVNAAQNYILQLSDKQFSGCNLLVVRGVEVSHVNSTFSELLAAIKKLGLDEIWESRQNPLSLKCKTTGNVVIFRGCSDQRAVERLKSVATPVGKIT